MAMDTSPVRFDVARPLSQSRLTNFPLGIGMLIRLVLLVPHLLILYFFSAVMQVVVVIASFAILFTGRFPQGMHGFIVGIQRWSSNVYGYLFHLYDAYPPFSMDVDSGYPLQYDVTYPESSSRLLNFPLLGFLLKAILLLPHLIALAFIGVIAYLILFIATFAILFTGSFPEGMHGFVSGMMRWGQRVTAYMLGLTDRYPPFGMN